MAALTRWMLAAGLALGTGLAACAQALEDPAGAHDPTLFVRQGMSTGQGAPVAASAAASASEAAATGSTIFDVFTTGPGLQHLRSLDGRRWQRLAPVFTEAPAWWAQAVPAHRGLDVWAPKVFRHDGRFGLLYSISTFGKNRSAIGLASAESLDGPWRDDGLVVNSVETDDFNAIDPDLFQDEEQGRLWLSYGSFWGGIRVTEVDAKTLRPIGDTRFIARRQGGIEAPTIVRHGAWVYLFVSHDFCCRGVASTYNIRVGRARSALGPFVDRDGVDLMDGGGTLVEQGAGRWHGPGHQDVVGSWIVRHAYDGEDHGRPKLRIDRLNWTEDGWPRL